jgi:hypothetical protein
MEDVTTVSKESAVSIFKTTFLHKIRDRMPLLNVEKTPYKAPYPRREKYIYIYI